MTDQATAQIKVSRKSLGGCGYKSLIIKGRTGYIAANQAIPIEQDKEKR